MRKRLFKFFKWSAIVLFGLVLLAELGLRIVYSDKLRLRSYPQVYQPDARLGYNYIPGAESSICVPGICKDIKINSEGFCGRPFNAKKEKGKVRIAVVGTSQATGIWMDGDSSYCMQLEGLFKENGYDSVEVVNFAVDGRFRSVFNLRFIIDDLPKYEPDLVFFRCQVPFVHGKVYRALYRNYVLIYDGRLNSSLQYCKDFVNHVREYSTFNFFYRNSYIVRAVSRWYMNNKSDNYAALLKVYVERKVQAPSIQFLPWSVKKSMELIKEARDTLAAQGGRLVLFDYMPEEYHAQIFEKHGLDYMSLEVPLAQPLVHADDGHYNEEGHAEVAWQMYEQAIHFPEFTGETPPTNLQAPPSVDADSTGG